MGWCMTEKPPPEEAVDETLIPEEEPREPTLADINKAESIVASLAKLFSDLLGKSSMLCGLNLQELRDNEDLPEAVQKLARKPRIDLAQKILRGYWDGQIPFLNDIVCTRFPTVVRDAYTRAVKTPGTPKDWPPPLPEISDKELESLVFMHSSCFNLHLFVSKLEANWLRSNERLEFLGDAVLERAACDLLYFRFPTDTEGDLTKKKVKMVCNMRLDEFAVLYKMDERLYDQLGDAARAVMREHKHKIYADTFEAYVGGLYLDKGYNVVRDWLYALYEPQVVELAGVQPISIFNQEIVRDDISTSKATLYKKVGSATRKPRYVCRGSGPPFTIEVWVDEVLLGEATAPSKKLAGNLAARDALKKTHLIEELSNVRSSIPRTAPVTGGVSP